MSLYGIIADLRREHPTPSASKTLDMVVTELGENRDNLREAIAHLEALSDKGAQYVLFPETAAWWLEYYAELAEMLQQVAAGATYDEIWSNPPIRIGKEALHDLLLHWFARLRPEGRAVLVVGKNLGGDSLQSWLTDRGYPTIRLASARGFRVLESRPT